MSVPTTEFRLTAEHLKLLRRMNVDFEDGEYGAPAVDPKRPYGNSSVAIDIGAILGWQVPDYESEDYPAFEERCRSIHAETVHAVQIVLRFAGAAVEPGLYRRQSKYDYQSWERVGD